MHNIFLESDKLADMVLANSRLFNILPYFGIELGFGEKTAAQVCAERGVSAPLFMLVCNIYAHDYYSPQPQELRAIPLEGLVAHLRRSHGDYIQLRVPRIVSAVLALPGGQTLAAFCEKYRQELIAHLRYEEEVVFPYIASLLAGERPDYSISEYETSHSDIDGALEDLKNIIVKYLPPECTLEMCRPVLQDLFAFEFDLRKHTVLEDTILIPLVERLDASFAGVVSTSPELAELSDREQEVLASLARGLSNKEVADLLHISTHTVISHRKNVMRKTGFKTAQGLTFFALHSGLISQEDFF